MRQARLFTIPPGARFLPTLCDALLDDVLGLGLSPDDPLGLARATIYLPTRRSAHALREALRAALQARTGRQAALMPRIRALGGLEEAEIALAGAAGDEAARDEAARDEAAREPSPPLPPAIAQLRRQLLLARQIEAWGRALNRACFDLDESAARLIPDGLGESVALAAHLSDLIDTMHASGVRFEALAKLDAARFDQLWEFTHRFLAIAGETWPAILASEGALDPADRRNRLIDAECARIAAGRLEGPVIAAGTTGSVPATARLLAAIAQSARGAVILPGLDPHLDDGAWGLIAHEAARGKDDPAISHPQAVMARLVAKIGLERADVTPLGAASPPLAARAQLASEALRPAETTHRWRAHPFGKALAQAALAGVSLVEAANEREEAAIIALGLREALEDPLARVALVTPDRGLAQRVAIELRRWGVTVDDSAGMSLARTQAGLIALLALDALDLAADPVTLATLAHHALLRVPRPAESQGMAEGACAAAALEIALLRGGLALPGLAGLEGAQAIATARRNGHHAAPPLRRLTDEEIAQAGHLGDALIAALAPLRALAAGLADVTAWAQAHKAALIALTEAAGEPPAAFAGDAGARLATLLDSLAQEAEGLPACTLRDYRDLCRALIGQEIIAPASNAPAGESDARVAILGLLEARLIDHDLVVLGGLNEGVWPGEAQIDPFLNRPMRQELGLPLPERRVGQSAHDFAQGLLGAPQVILTRALKAGLTQTVPSRFWQRLETVTPPDAWQDARVRGGRLASIAQQLTQPSRSSPTGRPAPVAPARLHPARLSVTEIETLARDPYAVYARRILKLAPLEPLVAGIGARERGQLFHDILARFANAWPEALPADARARLMEIADDAFAPLMREPEVAAFWKPRFAALADLLIAWEAQRRPLIRRVHAEIDGRMELALPGGGSVMLTARADRIEERRDGSLAIIDYKSGKMPGKGQIEAGLAVQLTLSAAITQAGGFGAGQAGWPAAAAYLWLKAEDGALKQQGKEGDALIALSREHIEHWRTALGDYRAGARGFVSRLAPEKQRDAGDYDALARVKEWSRGGEDETEAEA